MHPSMKVVVWRGMYGKTLSALAVLLIISVGIALFVWSSANESVYENSVHGYSLVYPDTLDIREYGDENAVIGTIEPDMVQGRAEIRILNVQGEAGQSLHQAVVEQLKNLCAADGPSASFSCTGIISTEPFTTMYGEQGFVLVLKGELKNLETGETEIIPKGPHYVLTIASSAMISKVLVIHPPLNQAQTDADTETIRSIAESVRLK